MIDYNKITELVIERYESLKEYNKYKIQFIQNKTLENYNLNRLYQGNYLSYQSKIYTFKNIIEFCRLLEQNNNKTLVFNETENEIINLSLSSNNLPMLYVTPKKLKDL